MIEIRRDVSMAEPGGPAGQGVDPLAAALGRLVDDVVTTASRHRRNRFAGSSASYGDVAACPRITFTATGRSSTAS
jgi:hypothetical protein